MERTPSPLPLILLLLSLSVFFSALPILYARKERGTSTIGLPLSNFRAITEALLLF